MGIPSLHPSYCQRRAILFQRLVSVMIQRAQSDAAVLHQDRKTCVHGFRHAAHQDDWCGRAEGATTASAHGYARSQRSRGCTKRGRHASRDLSVWRLSRVGIQLVRGRLPTCLCQRNSEYCSGKQHTRGSPSHYGRESVGATTASLLAPVSAPKTMVHSRRIELVAGSSCFYRRSLLHQPRVLEASAHRLAIAAALRSFSHCSSGGAWRQGDAYRLECTHRFCVTGFAHGTDKPAVVSFDTLPFPAASPTVASHGEF